jgi:hypothetical protein
MKTHYLYNVQREIKSTCYLKMKTRLRYNQIIGIHGNANTGNGNLATRCLDRHKQSVSQSVSCQHSEQRRDPRTAQRQDIRGPELIVTRKIVITPSRVVNKQRNKSSGVITDLTLYNIVTNMAIGRQRFSKHFPEITVNNGRTY